MRFLCRIALAAVVGLIAIAVLPSTGAAQLVREHDAKSLRGFHGSAGTRIKRSFQSDAEARNVLRYILTAAGLAGLEDRIILRASADTPNAEAYIDKNKDNQDERLIFYNAVFMQELQKQTKDYWSLVAVLAHELGHHVRFHTAIPGRDHEFELEADYQAGFILRRLGATIDQAQGAFRSIGGEHATASHPSRAERLQAVTIGWTDGDARHTPPWQTQQSQPPSVPPAVFKAPTPGGVTVSPTAERAEAAKAWNEAEGAPSIAAYEAVIARYPDGVYAELARARIEELKKHQTATVREAEARQADVQRIAAEQKAREAEAAQQQDQLRKAQEEVRQAREAQKVAEQAKIAAEKAAEDARKSAEALKAQREQQVAVATPPPPAAKPAPTKPTQPAVANPPAQARCDGVDAQVGNERRCLKPKDSFRDCPDCPEMVVVPAGEFMMGSPESEKDRGANEGPQHKVTIRQPFAVDKFEVTFAEWVPRSTVS